MVSGKLALPLSPPESPFMTDRVSSLDQKTLKWAFDVDHDKDAELPSQPGSWRASAAAGDLLESTQAGSGHQLQSLRSYRPIVKQAWNPQGYPSHVAPSTDRVRRPEAQSVPPDLTTDMRDPVISGRAHIAARNRSTRHFTQTRSLSPGTDDKILERGDDGQNNEPAQRSLTATELRASNLNSKRFR